MNIGNIVSTVQAEPLEEAFDIPPLKEEDLARYTVLVNEEITTAVREAFFSGAPIGG